MSAKGGDYLRRLRTDHAYTYESFAEAMGVHPITVRQWEKKKYLKPYVILAAERLCEGIHVRDSG